jgi:hypothetical protein
MPVLTPSLCASIEHLCDGIVAELLQELGLPPVNIDAFAVARGLGMDVAVDARQAGRARIKRIAGTQAVLLRPEERPERLQWALAHEIGESLAPRVAARLKGEGGEVAILREQWANLFASRLLLPRGGFLPLARQLDGNVIQLKRHFPNVSFEQLLWGLLRLEVPTVASVFDQGSLVRRIGNTGGKAPLTPWEREVWERVHETGECLDETAGPYRLQGWAIHEPPWKRELLRVTSMVEE